MLPDDVILAIFYFYLNEALGEAYSKESTERWQRLVHVCQRWRGIVFGSPCRLNLRLGCTPKTPARDLLDIWPALPLYIWSYGNYPTGCVENITAVLENSDRVRQVDLMKVSSSCLENVSAAMQVPFPELKCLELRSNDEIYETGPVLPDSFLGASAPCLRFLRLSAIPFPGLPRLLLSTTHLVTLRLFNIPHSGYIPPEMMVAALSTLTSLRFFLLGFQSPLSCPDWASRRPPPLTRSVLPALTYFSFKGVSEYLDDIVARIDVPRIDQLFISFFNQILFDTPHFIQFISRTPTFKAFKTARLFFGHDGARVELSSQIPGPRELTLSIPCRELDWQISSLEQVSASCLPFLSTLEDLTFSERQYSHLHWPDNIENTLWLELLHPFTSVKNLYLSWQVSPRIMPALQELIGARTTEVLPTLQNIFLEGLHPPGPVQECIGQFVAARQVAGHPIAISRWENPWPL
jgi:hypothetical protein